MAATDPTTARASGAPAAAEQGPPGAVHDDDRAAQVPAGEAEDEPAVGGHQRVAVDVPPELVAVGVLAPLYSSATFHSG